MATRLKTTDAALALVKERYWIDARPKDRCIEVLDLAHDFDRLRADVARLEGELAKWDDRLKDWRVVEQQRDRALAALKDVRRKLEGDHYRAAVVVFIDEAIRDAEAAPAPGIATLTCPRCRGAGTIDRPAQEQEKTDGTTANYSVEKWIEQDQRGIRYEEQEKTEDPMRCRKCGHRWTSLMPVFDGLCGNCKEQSNG